MSVAARMFARTPRRLTDDEVIDLSYFIAEAFGTELLVDGRTDPGRGRGILTTAINGTVHTWPVAPCPGPSLPLPPGVDHSGNWIALSLGAGDYYGPGYERGEVWNHIALARWLEQRVPGIEVWYGPDTPIEAGSPRAQRFDDAARRALFARFCRVGHKPARARDFRMPADVSAPHCCRRPMSAAEVLPHKVRCLCLACGATRVVTR